MQTLMKYPIYVEIISDDRIDRSLITKAATEFLYPSILHYLSSAKIQETVRKKILKASKSTQLEINLLTEKEIQEKIFLKK